MNEQTDQELLRSYGERQDQAAFTELVSRHVDVVYSTALRIVRDSHLAEDVAQSVFVALVQKAPELRNHPVLVGWLHRTTQYIAVKLVRSEVRRRAREQESTMDVTDDTWEEIAPELDSALGDLGEPEREALLLRYFQQKSASEIAALVGISAEAAQKRVSRAVERLRSILEKRGVAVGASALAVLMCANAVQSAPAGLALGLSASVLAQSGGVAAEVSTVSKTIAMTTLHKMAIGVVIVAGIAGSVLVNEHYKEHIREAEAALRRDAQELKAEQVKKQELVRLAGLFRNPSPNNEAEFKRLRDELELLRSRTNSIAGLLQEQERLREAVVKTRRDPNRESTALSDLAKSRSAFCRDLGLSLYIFASEHQKIPANLDVVQQPGKGGEANDSGLSADQFEIVFKGSIDDLEKRGARSDIVLIRERNPWQNTDGKWVKTYAFADGHSELVSLKDGDFETWEKKHIASAERGNP